MSKESLSVMPSGVIAIIRTQRSYIPDAVFSALTSGGIVNIEITTNSPNSWRTTRRWLGFDGAKIGVGTVRNEAQIDAAISLDANFIVTPTFIPAVLSRATAVGVPVVCGAMTPTEIESAWNAGACGIKIFPISNLGGVNYVKSVAASLSNIPFLPTGGVTPGAAESYAALGCAGVGVGSELVNEELIVSKSWNEIERRARVFSEAWNSGLGKQS